MSLILILIDFGLVILTWTVQMVVYPGFVHYSDEDLARWHPTYTTNITYIVAPLMVSQLALHAWELITAFTWLELITLTLVIVSWAITFKMAVPLHQKISERKELKSSSMKLVQVNWIRTAVWSLIFLINLLQKF